MMIADLRSRAATRVSGAPRLRRSLCALALLMAYLIGGGLLIPGFCDYWMYLAIQVAAVAALLVVGEVLVADEGGLSWITHVMAVACCVFDVAGNQWHLYADIRHYDKVAHFAGIAALTAGMYEVMQAMNARGRLSMNARDRLVWAAGIGFALGIGWEFYEYFGDKMFNTARFGGPQDTAGDLLWDAIGAVTVGVLLMRAELASSDGEASAFDDERRTAGPPS